MTDTTNSTLIAWLLASSTIAVILLLALLGMMYAFWLTGQSLRQAKKRLDSFAGIDPFTAAHHADSANRLSEYRRILNSSGGGIGKRISECREIAEAVSKRAPELFKTEPGLIYWLEATDQVLLALFEIDREWYGPNQERCATSRSALIYQDIHDKSGSPLPHGRVITSSGVLLNDGE